jgi:formylglycine-generating enzyme required for sulfatase activity
MLRTIAALAFSITLAAQPLGAQTLFGSGCAGASGVTPTLAVNGTVKAGSTWSLEATAPGGLGLAYLLIGFSNTNSSVFGGQALPIDLATLFGDPLWSGCSLLVDPSYAIAPYLFDPNTNGGTEAFDFPGFDLGTLYVQAVNIDPDFTTRIAGVSRGLVVRRTPPVGTVAIQPGSFAMGSNAPSGAPYYNASAQQPVHTVVITYPFWMGRHEVTQAEYLALMGSNPSAWPGPQRPVTNVSWASARAYCAALTVQETLAGNVPAGYEYRLPTEAEWEYACRAGTTTEFNLGDALTCGDALIFLSDHTGQLCTSGSGTFDVGSFAPNAWGLYDMHGNVSEWCLDAYAGYQPGEVEDPFVSAGLQRVVRGGSFVAASRDCRSARRLLGNPVSVGVELGFRVVLAPILVP